MTVDIKTVEADPKRPWKAYASTALTFISLFVASWIADVDPFTAKEIGGALIGAAIGSGVVGGVTYAVKNPMVKKA